MLFATQFLFGVIVLAIGLLTAFGVTQQNMLAPTPPLAFPAPALPYPAVATPRASEPTVTSPAPLQRR